jgi:catechol 2,3-dioxygenase-like lactoylglutathione lyase family enzyme
MASGDSCVAPRGLHHAGVVVGDLAISVPFYEQMFGARQALRVDHDHLSLVMLELANTSIELVVHRPPGRGDLPGATDLGAGHIALLMDDVEDAHARLAERGVRFASPPERIPDNAGHIYVIAFCLDPDGNRIELIQPPSDR